MTFEERMAEVAAEMDRTMQRMVVFHRFARERAEAQHRAAVEAIADGAGIRVEMGSLVPVARENGLDSVDGPVNGTAKSAD